MTELLIRKRQLALKAEGTKGTYETGLDTDATAATLADFNLVDPSWTPESTSFTRDIRSATLSLFPSTFPGVTSAQVTFGVELAGHMDNSSGSFVEPPLARILSFCGFESKGSVSAIAAADVASVVGVFRHGETVTGGTSGETATVIGGYRDGYHSKLYLADISGTFTAGAGETITGGSSGATATISSDDIETDTLWASYPLSDPANIDTASGIYYIDGKRAKFKGARGDVSFSFPHGDRVLATVTLTGVLEDYVDGALLTGANAPTINQDVPPANLGTSFQFHDGTTAYSPCYNTLEIGMNNSTILRECTGQDDGWDFATISARQPGGSINVDEVLNSEFNYVNFYENGTTLDTLFTVGSTVGNRVEFRAPALQITSLPEGNRDDVTIWDMQFALTAGQFSDGSFGADNELILLYT